MKNWKYHGKAVSLLGKLCTPMRRTLHILLSLLLLLPLGLRAQQWPTTENDSDSLTVSLLTCAPGHQLYRIYGHTGVRIENAHNPKDDWAYNFGWFSFGDPGFVMKFIFGRTAYTMAQQSTAMFLSSHMRDDMTVTQQVLNLTPEQKEAVRKKLTAPLTQTGFDREEFAVPNIMGTHDTLALLTPHWTYRYDFLYDNCTTRAVKAIVQTIEESGEQVVYPTLAASTQQLTQRGMIHEFTQASPWYELGQDLLLGSHVDQEHSVQEMTQLNFLPTYAQNFFQQAQIKGKDGRLRPLVIETQPLFPLVPQAQRSAMPMGPGVALSLLLLFGALLTFGEWRSWRKSPASQRAWRIWGLGFDAVLYIGLGIVGILIALLVFGSSYPAVKPNWLLLVFHPLLLLLLPYRWWASRRGKKYWAAPLLALGCVLLVGVQALGVQHIPLGAHLLSLTLLVRQCVHLLRKPALTATTTPLSPSTP